MQWVKNPYWQCFCGAKWFEYEVPIDPSSMTRWRNKGGEEGVKTMLSQTIAVLLKKSSLQYPLIFLQFRIQHI